MAHLKFEGDISSISARQLEFISSVLEQRGYTNEKVLIQAVGKDGDNYVANVKRITVEKNGDKFQMIAKIAPGIEGLRIAMNTPIMFQNEHIMYTRVLPMFAELQRGADIPEKERLRYAACYGTLTEAPNEVILLEDLQLSGFVMLDRLVSFTDDTVRLVLKNFALLHSCSYALKKLDPDTYEDIKVTLTDMWELMNQVPETKIYFEQLEKETMEMLDNVQHKSLIKGTVSNLVVNGLKNKKIDSKSKYSVIQQGDSWTNNIMFALEGGIPVNCCMIDYQISKANSPVADLHYMIFNCTDHEIRDKHYYDWIDYYHSELDKALSNFGLKANFAYPRDQLDADLKRHGKIAFGQSLMLATILLRESSEATKLKAAMETMDINDANNMEKMAEATKLSTLDEKTILRFRNRIEGMLKSFVKFGYL